MICGYGAGERTGKILKTLVVVIAGCFTAAVMSSCGSIPWNSETAVSINPSKFHEDCVELLPGDSLIYSFRTSEPVDFNVHYHENGKILYPVSKKNVAGRKGEYKSTKKQFYCLMWTNTRKEPVSLTYSYDIREK